MSVTFPYYPPQNGRTCHNCGNWIPDGCTHSCPTSVRWVNPPAPPARPVDERIADALERIAAVLEREEVA